MALSIRLSVLFMLYFTILLQCFIDNEMQYESFDEFHVILYSAELRHSDLINNFIRVSLVERSTNRDRVRISFRILYFRNMTSFTHELVWSHRKATYTTYNLHI